MKFEIDPELQYCPRCRDEYRADVKMCATCEVELINGARMLQAMADREARMGGRPVEITGEDELVEILKGPVLNVKQLQARLAAEGFPSLVAGDENTCGKGCCGGNVSLQVRSADLQEIMGYMAREHIQTTGLADHDTSYADAVYDTSALSVTCPACGCCFSPRDTICPDCGLCF